MHVLLVDDDRNAVELLAYLVQEEFPDATVDIGFDGKHAVELAKARRPDVVIMDLEMPVMDGEHSARAIAELYADALPYLIALSGNIPRLSHLQGAGLFRSLQAKPCDLERLFSTLRQ